MVRTIDTYGPIGDRTQRRLRVGRLPRAQPRGVSHPDLAPGARVGDPHRPQHDRRVEQVRLGKGGRPPVDASHGVNHSPEMRSYAYADLDVAQPMRFGACSASVRWECPVLGAVRTWSPPRIWSTACTRIGRSTLIPSLTPPDDPGRLTISVRDATPASPRDRIADGTPAAAPAERRASAMPGISRSMHPPGHLRCHGRWGSGRSRRW